MAKLLPTAPSLRYFDYGQLETAIAGVEATIPRTRTAFDRVYAPDETKKHPAYPYHRRHFIPVARLLEDQQIPPPGL